MDGYLKQSTAAQTRWIGPFVDDTDFKTAETGLTIANTDIKVSANGGASASKNSGGGTHDVNGMYAVTWDATDTATVGELKYSVKVAGALQVFGSYVVLEEAIYDALFAASAAAFDANQDVTVGAIANNAITAASIAADAITAAKVADGTIDAATFAAGAINAAAIAADAITAAKVADGTIDAATFAAGAITATAIAADAIGASELAADAVTEIQSGLATAAALDTIDNFLDTEIAAILSDTNAIKLVTDLLTAADAEPTGVPAADETPLVKLAYLFMALRNRVDITSTKKTFYDDGGAAEWEKDLSDDGSTYSESEGNAI